MSVEKYPELYSDSVFDQINRYSIFEKYSQSSRIHFITNANKEINRTKKFRGRLLLGGFALACVNFFYTPSFLETTSIEKDNQIAIHKFNKKLFQQNKEKLGIDTLWKELDSEGKIKTVSISSKIQDEQNKIDQAKELPDNEKSSLYYLAIGAAAVIGFDAYRKLGKFKKQALEVRSDNIERLSMMNADPHRPKNELVILRPYQDREIVWALNRQAFGYEAYKERDFTVLPPTGIQPNTLRF